MIDGIKDMTPDKALRFIRCELYGMKRRQFCEYFDIPIRSSQHWEIGDRKPAPFVLNIVSKCYELEQENARLREYIDLLNRQNEELKSIATASLQGDE